LVKQPNPIKTYRIIDANLNRAREGLRVIEDTLRFVFDNPNPAKRIKRIRHELDHAAAKVYPSLISARNSQKDFGARTKERGKREGVKGILMANFRRTEEALRVLEEYSRMISGEYFHPFKRLRFRVYTVEKEVMSDKKTEKMADN